MTDYSDKNNYALMNKDAPILDFRCRRNEFGEPEFAELQWHTNLRPIGYRGLTTFLEMRKAPKHRKHIQQLLEQYGCDDLEGFLQVTHALSLNDTFWVRPADSALTWREASLYTNDFSEIISQAAFDGTVSETDLSSTSPEFGTDGYYAKCWVREGPDICLYKSGSAHYEIEPLSEYLAAQLAAELCPGAVPYDMDYHHGKLVSKCPLVTSERVGLAKASAVFRGEERTLPELLAYFANIGSEDAFRRMCVLDAVILNTDRHYGNYGVLFDTDTLEIQSMAPVFDHNRSLLPELDNDQLSQPGWYLKRCRPRLGRDFLLNARGLLTASIRNDLKRLEGFQFQQHPIIHAEQDRLDELSSIVREQVRLILAD